METRLNALLTQYFHQNLDTCTNCELLQALLLYTKEKMSSIPRPSTGKKLYYISAEFLLGKLLSNNLINLGLYEEAGDLLAAHGHSLAELEELEPEPSLGNGGLGRLAACFLDSIATLGLPGDGIGLNYHFGLFRQEFRDDKQYALKNPWIWEHSWLTRRPEAFIVPFKAFTLRGVLYDLQVPGYRSGESLLHLFDVDSVNEGLVEEDSIRFDQTKIQENLTLFLYPDDTKEEGCLLRICQQYFMVSCGAQLILKECKEKGADLRRLYDYAVVQINDTHPSLVIPELIRLLTGEGLTMDEAVEAVEKTCAYTNHTILAEALEKWPMAYLEKTVPHLLPIIRELDARVRRRVADASTYIIDEENRVHMAHMDIHYGFSVNGVAALHTEILKHSELKNFYQLYPEKFNNKTNGITFRRWLLKANPLLTEWLRGLIGDDFQRDAGALERLLDFQDHQEVLDGLSQIKRQNKEALVRYLQESQGISLDADSIFDVQIKRLHEYKRQQMNALFAIHQYLEIKRGKIPSTPITLIFGAKAAPAYTIAQDIIHLLLCLQKLTERDEAVRPHFRVVMVENYNVTAAEKIIPAADISEQISLASKEASGTGNMKLMLNGAVTLGTEDGANVEIRELVGDENIYIFGKDPKEVLKLYASGGYSAKRIYEGNAHVRELVDFLIGEELLGIGDRECLGRLHRELAGKDWFMTLLDLEEYISVKSRIYEDYERKREWAKKCLVNIAKAGFFSSDRTVREYAKEIWKL